MHRAVRTKNYIVYVNFFPNLSKIGWWYWQYNKMSQSWNMLKAVVAQIVITMAVLHHGGVEASLNTGQIKTKSDFSLSSPSSFIQAVDEKIRRVDASDVTVIHETQSPFKVSYGKST